MLPLLILPVEPSPVSLNHTSRSQRGKDLRVDGVFDGIVNMATGCDSSSSSDSINNPIVFACLADLASDSLGLAMLSKSSGSGEVAKTVDALEFLVAVGRGLQVLNESTLVLDTLAAASVRTSKFANEIDVELHCVEAPTIGIH